VKQILIVFVYFIRLSLFSFLLKWYYPKAVFLSNISWRIVDLNSCNPDFEGYLGSHYTCSSSNSIDFYVFYLSSPNVKRGGDPCQNE
jgi:hypothetical protein